METKDRASRVAVLTALRDAIDAIIDDERADLTQSLKDLNQSFGVKAIDIELPNGDKVASVTLTTPEPKAYVVNEYAFLKWVNENHPTELVQTVRDSFKKVLLDNTSQVGEVAVHTVTGEVIDGVAFRDSNARMTLRFKKEGRDLVALAYNRGELDNVVRPLGFIPRETNVRSVGYSPNENLGDSPTINQAIESEPSGALGG